MMDRRTLLQSAAMSALAGMSGVALAAPAPAAAPAMHDHHQHHAAGGKFQAIAASAGHCLSTGESCLAHCLVLLGQGDKQMAACAQSVSELMAVCSALQKLALQDSKRTAALAKLALEVCQDCEKQCRKHEKHSQCKDCADACADCAKQCKSLLG